MASVGCVVERPFGMRQPVDQFFRMAPAESRLSDEEVR